MSIRLLEAFKAAFQGKQYLHRNQTIGNFVASHLYEDLVELGRSQKISDGVGKGVLVANTANLVKGKAGRRGDGTFGALIPGELAMPETGFIVQRGPVASILIGAEMKILAKSMIKQIDRVANDLRHQAATFKEQNPKAIAVALVGVNFSDAYTSYEGKRSYPADPPPSREALSAIQRLQDVTRSYDEFVVLRFLATNVTPYPFKWLEDRETRQSYSAALLRISTTFDERF